MGFEVTHPDTITEVDKIRRINHFMISIPPGSKGLDNGI
jgi:hypothetical protein